MEAPSRENVNKDDWRPNNCCKKRSIDIANHLLLINVYRWLNPSDYNTVQT